ncbi:MAG: T9SS type A sorting domain-containing protein, partial [Ignavibacteriales bacterium]|nr:T9SS type A sorting domain-containing protein [Ignavibacteriales bacterium]
NPFNASTTIAYGLPQELKITLEAFNSLGQRVTILVEGIQGAGSYEVAFESPLLPSGVYFYRLTAEPLSAPTRNSWSPSPNPGLFRETRKMLLLR